MTCSGMNLSPKFPDNLNLAFVEELHASFLENPDSVSEEWRQYFSALQNGEAPVAQKRGPSFRRRSIFNPAGSSARSPASDEAAVAHLQDKVNQLIRNFRGRGHMIARLDPLKRSFLTSSYIRIVEHARRSSLLR